MALRFVMPPASRNRIPCVPRTCSLLGPAAQACGCRGIRMPSHIERRAMPNSAPPRGADCGAAEWTSCPDHWKPS
ncbi:MAG: hypothetical protein QOC94_4731 [Actinoplanes sp.]|nr:hypothetical protein [Actinoplanes sp.]